VRSAPGAGLVDTQLISNMAWGYAVVDHQHEELLHLLGDQARACMQALKPLELCNVVRGQGQLTLPPCLRCLWLHTVQLARCRLPASLPACPPASNGLRGARWSLTSP